MERLTITLPPEMASMVRGAVDEGDYASSSEIVREALRDWRVKRLEQARAMTEMRGFIAEGVRDLGAGRVRDFSPDDIKAAGRRKSQDAVSD